MAAPVLAGTLEKRARWRKEWRARFCVMRQDRIDYFMQPPAIVDDENSERARGSIPLCEAVATEEPGRPHCIRVGDVLLSCASQAEQQRWLKTILAAAGVDSSRPPPRPHATSDEVEEPALVLLPPGGPARELQWREPWSVLLASADSAAVVLLQDGCGTGGCTWACRLQVFGAAVGETSFPAEPLGRSAAGQRGLRVQVRDSEPAATAGLPVPAGSCLCLAAAVLAAGSVALAALLLAAMAVLLAALPQKLLPPPAQRRITLSIEGLEDNSATAPAPTLAVAAPLWAGRWRLDKACSEKYEPILADMGVNYLLRKAADAVKSALIISVTETHVTIHVKTLVAVEDTLPLDGSWAWKPVPPGGRMRGQMRVRLTRVSALELEMLSEFPNGEGELRDTLTVHEDGSSFTRKVVRGELSVTRIFRREH